MIDDSQYGSRDKRGHWKPFKLSSNIPFFDWPFSITKNLKWLLGIPGYIFPWTFFYGSIAVLLWVYFTPSLETMKTFQLGWISYLLIRNLIIMLICGTALHFLLYIKKLRVMRLNLIQARCLKIIKISFLKIKLKIIFFGPCAAEFQYGQHSKYFLCGPLLMVTLLA